jgi:hypothetical protein
MNSHNALYLPDKYVGFSNIRMLNSSFNHHDPCSELSRKREEDNR